MRHIPTKEKRIVQTNVSDVLGDVWASFNLDLIANRGRIRISPRGMYTTTTDDVATIDNVPTQFLFYDNFNNSAKMVAIIGNYIFTNAGEPEDVFVQDALTGTPTGCSNGGTMQLFNGALYVVADGVLYKHSGTWTTVSTALNGGDASSCVFGGRFYFTQSGSQICSVDKSDVLVEPATPNNRSYSLQLSDFPPGGSNANKITCIRATSDRIWIATADSSSQFEGSTRMGRIFEWDGVSTQPAKVYNLDSRGALSMAIKDDVPYVVDTDGKLLKFNGSSFEAVARFPIPRYDFLKNPSGSETQRFIHANGMCTVDGRLFILISNVLQMGSTITPACPGGIWEYSESTGLYHKQSLSIWKSGAVNDYAYNRISAVGAIAPVKNTRTSGNTMHPYLIFGAGYRTTSSTSSGEKYGVFIDDTLGVKSKMGYFVSTKIEAEAIKDNFRGYIKHKPLITAGDHIDIKFRTNEFKAIDAPITWTSTTVLTTTTALTNIAVGDEVEITQGPGAGQIEHVTAISEVGGTYTVTLANAVIGVTAAATSRARFDKWTMVGKFTDTVANLHEFVIPIPSTWVQVKCVVYLSGGSGSTEWEIEELGIINTPHTPYYSIRQG